MTQYLNEILTAKTRLSEEELDKLVTSLYLHKNKEDNYFQTHVLQEEMRLELTCKSFILDAYKQGSTS
jgi:hypothetical protein